MERYIENEIDHFVKFIKQHLNEKQASADKWRGMYNNKDAEFENYKNNAARVQAEKCKGCRECKMIAPSQ